MAAFELILVGHPLVCDQPAEAPGEGRGGEEDADKVPFMSLCPSNAHVHQPQASMAVELRASSSPDSTTPPPNDRRQGL